MHFKKLFCSAALVFCLCFTQVGAQPVAYTVANAHAHNDYEHPLPFYTAYGAGFGSIEADVIFFHGRLCVTHDTTGIVPQKTLQSLYLDPLQKEIQRHKGSVYGDSAKNLLLLIDLKTPAEPTLTALANVLQQYKTLTACRSLKIVITGNQPDLSTLPSYPSYLYFDGKPGIPYPPEALGRIALFSDDFRNYSKWKGEGNLPDSARSKIENAVAKTHGMNKPIRFWAAPDGSNTWLQLMHLNVDYINTDKIAEIAAFFKKQEN